MAEQLTPTYHVWLKTHEGGSLDEYFTDVQNLTPYDKGTRLEPKPWITPTTRRAVDHDDYGKVDFDNEESATVFTVRAEQDGEGYVLKVDDLSGTPLRVELSPMYPSAERTMMTKAALHLFHIEMGESPAYWSYEREQLVTLRNELIAAGIPEREVDGNGTIPEEEES